MIRDTTSRVAVIGATSATDVEAVLRELSSRERLAVLVHCTDPMTSSTLREAFDRVADARLGTSLEAGVIHVVTDGTLDAVLRATADTYATQTIAIILAGAEPHAQLGIKRVKEAGGITMAQARIAGSAIDLVLDPKDLALGLQAIATLPSSDESSGDGETLRDILALVRVRTGHDFTSYKRGTLFRRLSRRMQVCRLSSIADYHRHVREHPAELAALLRDFLIGVTQFFRDADSFDALARQVPALFANKAPDEPVRVWVPGCATGEEVYSIAMLLDEHARDRGVTNQLQLFATDIDEDSLRDARDARYPESIAIDVSEQRLARYFVHEDGHYRIAPALRDLVLFSSHDLLRSPPFSRIDLISCRNLLIYLNREAQGRVLKLFHFALRDSGMLFLGASESAENLELFSAIDAKSRIYQRQPASYSVDALVAPPATLPVGADRPSSLSELHFRLLERYAPPSVLVDGQLDVIHVSEHAGRYFAVGGGEPTKQVLRLVMPELQLDLRSAIHATQHSGHEETRLVRFEVGGTRRAVELRVVAGVLEEAAPGALLVFFEEREALAPQAVPASSDPVKQARDQLRAAIERYEISNEELAASNEELHAINEQLRSTTAELEGSKQALESMNQELAALNEELRRKLDEIGSAGADLDNLMSSADLGVLFLDRKLDIRRFTPRAQDLFNLIATDRGRPLSHTTHRLEVTDLAELSRSVLRSLRAVEREVTSTDGRRYVMRLVPYRSQYERVDGVIVTFLDVTELRAAEEALTITEQRLAQALRTRRPPNSDEQLGS